MERSGKLYETVEMVDNGRNEEGLFMWMAIMTIYGLCSGPQYLGLRLWHYCMKFID